MPRNPLCRRDCQSRPALLQSLSAGAPGVFVSALRAPGQAFVPRRVLVCPGAAPRSLRERRSGCREAQLRLTRGGGLSGRLPAARATVRFCACIADFVLIRRVRIDKFLGLYRAGMPGPAVEGMYRVRRRRSRARQMRSKSSGRRLPGTPHVSTKERCGAQTELPGPPRLPAAKAANCGRRSPFRK